MATLRAVVQLIILGFLLHYIFKINDKWLLVLCVFVIIMLLGIRLVDHHLSCIMSFGFPLWLSLLERHYRLQVLLRQGPSIYNNEVIPIGGMLANNGLIAINLAYQNLDRAFVQDGTNIESKLSLAATPKLASKGAIRESIRLAIVPTIDSVKTYGLVSIPGMMTGLIIGGVPPLQAIKFQLLVVFIHTTATIMSALIATYLSYGQFFNARHQLVARNTDVKSES